MFTDGLCFVLVFSIFFLFIISYILLIFSLNSEVLEFISGKFGLVVLVLGVFRGLMREH